MEILTHETEEDLAQNVTAFVLELARREAVAAGRRFDPEAANAKARVDLAVVETLDEMGFLDPLN